MLHWAVLALLLGSGACASAGQQKEKKVEQKKEVHPLSRGEQSLFVVARMAAPGEQCEEFTTGSISVPPCLSCCDCLQVL